MRWGLRVPVALVAIVLSLTLFSACGGEEEAAAWSWDEDPTPVAVSGEQDPDPEEDDCEPMPDCIEVTVDLSVGNAEDGMELFEKKGCVACHKVAEDGPGGEIGPLLAGIGDPASRPTLAAGDEGAAGIPNTPENIWRWVQFPQKIKPGTEMAPQPLTEQEAADLVAYLQTLK
ncbi:MAG: c-type cytochrome [Chloroflexota bacterium]|nr:c-type cytochrome [Chloroflexota bacterium]MDE2841146.1 c-type cytochrome [Chloroflexota bacterium]MDE2930170.1 c-type cytochrome [Chloroflexota bacterium]